MSCNNSNNITPSARLPLLHSSLLSNLAAEKRGVRLLSEEDIAFIGKIRCLWIDIKHIWENIDFSLRNFSISFNVKQAEKKASEEKEAILVEKLQLKITRLFKNIQIRHFDEINGRLKQVVLKKIFPPLSPFMKFIGKLAFLNPGYSEETNVPIIEQLSKEEKALIGQINCLFINIRSLFVGIYKKITTPDKSLLERKKQQVVCEKLIKKHNLLTRNLIDRIQHLVENISDHHLTKAKEKFLSNEQQNAETLERLNVLTWGFKNEQA